MDSRARAIVATAVAVLSLAACARPADRSVARELPTPTPSRSSSPSPSPSPARPTDAPAADGSDLSACFDGTCEVEVKTGDVIRFGERIRATPPVDRIQIVSVAPGNTGFLLPGGTIAYGTNITVNDALHIEVIRADGRRAVIRFSPAS
ncbi:hypothetical protein Val02_46570 [Virgisporangium aliadipatigenens]|uniref:Lipoprotein n=1 Tax=Virgisporangium aliadipatigenens TaxID=741659 RepID=A0A8J4DS44_9ACTN|nr:hypothetical protein [Virgisporangium aliadipatigenens]GIJ47771.1 hypothetical protein Val02_46570 [Virgisporangium aliadipatigenens]